LPNDKRIAVLAASAMITALIWISVLATDRSVLKVTFLDVGDGLCTVVRTPSGKTMVFDCGTSSWRDNESIGTRLAAPYLQSMGIDKIDVAVLSHPHSDHVSGFAGLLAAKPAKLVLDTGIKEGSPEYMKFIRAIRKCHARYRIAKRGQVLDMGDGVKVKVLDPTMIASNSDLNEECIVLRIVYGQSAFLLAADAGDEAEHEMLSDGIKVRAQLLQVGHHGSRLATSPEWIEAVKPDIAVISCARNSQYHFPSRQVVERLEASGARVYITGKDGAIQATTDGNTIWMRTFRNSW